MSNSIWESVDQTGRSCYGKMECMEVTDVVIIGGGLCGLLCAWFLKDTGIDCILLDKDQIAGGTSKNAMGQVTSQHGLIYSKLLEREGEERARMYLQANELAIEKYRELAGKIACDFENRSSYIYSGNNREQIEREVEAVNRLGKKAEFCEDVELPFDISGAIRFKGQAQLNPVKLMQGLVKELENYRNIHIYEGIEIDDWLETAVWCKRRVIVSDYMICATQYPFYKNIGQYNKKIHLEEAYILALENAQKLHGMYTDADKGGLSFRSYGDLLFMARGMQRMERKNKNDIREWKMLQEKAEKYYPDARKRAEWKIQDCMSLDGIPYIGMYTSKTPKFYVATGFNGWGMTSAMLSALLLTDTILKDKSGRGHVEGAYPWREVFDPDRKILIPQYFSNIRDNISNKFVLMRGKNKK